MADDNSVGTVAWTDPDNAKVSDNIYTSAYKPVGTGAGFYSHILRATNFGFSIPDGHTILGFKAEFEQLGQRNSTIYSYAVKLINASGTIVGSGQEDNVPWTTTEGYYTYGTGTTDKWGTSLIYSDVNSSNFGVSLRVYSNTNSSLDDTAYIDHIRLTVYHEASSGPANLKTYNTNAKANIKTINTNAIANVKTLDTNA